MCNTCFEKKPTDWYVFLETLVLYKNKIPHEAGFLDVLPRMRGVLNENRNKQSYLKYNLTWITWLKNFYTCRKNTLVKNQD